jgi:hypothetical protein
MVDSNSNVDIEFSANYAFLGWPSQGSHELKRFNSVDYKLPDVSSTQ